MWQIYLPNKNTDVILGIAKSRHRRNARTHSYLIVYLNKARAEKIVATRGLICITLYIHIHMNTMLRDMVIVKVFNQEKWPVKNRQREDDRNKETQNNSRSLQSSK